MFDALTETKLALLVRSFSEVLSIGNDGGGAPARRRRISILDASEPRPAVFRPALEETCWSTLGCVLQPRACLRLRLLPQNVNPAVGLFFFFFLPLFEVLALINGRLGQNGRNKYWDVTWRQLWTLTCLQRRPCGAHAAVFLSYICFTGVFKTLKSRSCIDNGGRASLFSEAPVLTRHLLGGGVGERVRWERGIFQD